MIAQQHQGSAGILGQVCDAVAAVGIENQEQSGLVDLIRGKLPADVLFEMQKAKPETQPTLVNEVNH